MPDYLCLLVVAAAVGSVSAEGNFSSLAEVMVSSQALRVRGGDPVFHEKAEVRPLSRAYRDLTQGTTSTNNVINTTNRPSTTIIASKQETQQGRGHMKKLKKQFKKIAPYLMVPGMMALGYAPFILASLKMFVMNALTLNMMAFNAAIFLTLRNMVFGPRKDEHIKYYNFGYKKKHAHWR